MKVIFKNMANDCVPGSCITAIVNASWALLTSKSDHGAPDAAENMMAMDIAFVLIVLRRLDLVKSWHA